MMKMRLTLILKWRLKPRMETFWVRLKMRGPARPADHARADRRDAEAERQVEAGRGQAGGEHRGKREHEGDPGHATTLPSGP